MIENYIGWPTKVSQVILSDTSISMGEEATNTDSLQSGVKRTELKGGYIPDKYSVVMEFEWEAPLEAGTDKTEYQRFCEWYKYEHKYGSVPFYFPKILYSPQSGLKSLDEPNKPEVYEYYKITSGISNAQRSGSKMRISMTWETVFGGTVQIGPETPAVNPNLALTKNTADVVFTVEPSSIPNQNNFSLKDITDGDNTPIAITGFAYQDGTARMWFNDLTAGTHTLECTIDIPNVLISTKPTGTIPV